MSKARNALLFELLVMNALWFSSYYGSRLFLVGRVSNLFLRTETICLRGAIASGL